MDQRVRVAGRPIPELCLIRRLSGHRCPGCGMTRAMAFLVRFRVVRAVKVNPLVVPLFMVLGALVTQGVHAEFARHEEGTA
jgi:hypothetical protein